MVHILDWPTGSGKTPKVLKLILEGAGNKRSVISKKIRQTLIVLPNREMRKAWLRELGLIYIKKGFLDLSTETQDDFESFWRGIGYRKKQRILHEHELSVPLFLTFREFFRSRSVYRRMKFEPCRYLVLDEWHRISSRRKSDLMNSLGNKNYPNHWWCLHHKNYRKDKRNIYLCSATPLNPTREEKREDDLKGSIGEYKFESDIKQELKSTAALISLLSGFDLKELQTWKEISIRGKIKIIPLKDNVVWKQPVDCYQNIYDQLRSILSSKDSQARLRDVRSSEVGHISKILAAHNGFGYEYNYTAGVIATKSDKKKRKFFTSLKAKNKSFGFKYKMPFNNFEKSQTATRWLLRENGKVLRLFFLLETFGIIRRKFRGNSMGFEIIEKRKVVLFCGHQSTARGLLEVLRDCCLNKEKQKLIRSNIESGVKKVRWQSRSLIDDFNNSPHPQILIATDALSESYDLHNLCDTLIHYELPWSPITLFQRVGRVTRILSDKGVKNGVKPFLRCQRGRIGHVIVPGSTEEERVNRLIRRIYILSRHSLLPGINRRQWADANTAIKLYIGLGPSWHLRDWMKGNGLIKAGQEG
jgi:hypothetical protein